MTFDCYPLRFEYVAKQELYFPAGKAANTLRGALGLAFRKLVCVPTCTDARSCPVRDSCAYAAVFEPVSKSGPSGLVDSPRPFVFRARHLDARVFRPGERFHFDFHVFSGNAATLATFARVFEAMGGEGLGPRRGAAEFRTSISPPNLPRVSIDLSAHTNAPRKLRVDFLSPTELKYKQQIAPRPEFPILFSRIRDRISSLCALYGSGPPEIDFRGIGERAAQVKMSRCELACIDTTRRSSRTGQTHSIGGFTGFAEYEGDLAEFLPYLQAARWAGVGRQAVWGKGEIAVRPHARGNLNNLLR